MKRRLGLATVDKDNRQVISVLDSMCEYIRGYLEYTSTTTIPSKTRIYDGIYSVHTSAKKAQKILI